MTWSYSGNPADSDKDRIRFLIGDTDSTFPLMTDEEINYVITTESNDKIIALRCCESISASLAKKVSGSMGRISVQEEQLMKHYEQLCRRFRKSIPSVPYVGGLSLTEKEMDKTNTNLTQLKISKGIHDYE